MTTPAEINPNELRREIEEALRFDAGTGDFFWRKDGRRVRAGQLAGSLNCEGYRRIKLNQREYLAHRLAFFMYTNEWPVIVDHIDGNKQNNSFNNLRAATPSESVGNIRINKQNKVGRKGVSTHSLSPRFRARIQKNGAAIHLGMFNTIEEAHAAYEAAANKLFGEFARIQ